MKTNQKKFFLSDRKEKRRKSRNHTNRHHLVNKCKGGSSSKRNLLIIDIFRHRAWHELFQNLNLDEVIELLIRVKRAKENQTL